MAYCVNTNIEFLILLIGWVIDTQAREGCSVPGIRSEISIKKESEILVWIEIIPINSKFVHNAVATFWLHLYIAFLSSLGFHFWRTMCKKSSLSPPGFDFETTVCIVTHQINGLTCHVQEIKMQPKIQLHENEIMILLSTDMQASCLSCNCNSTYTHFFLMLFGGGIWKDALLFSMIFTTIAVAIILTMKIVIPCGI